MFVPDSADVAGQAQASEAVRTKEDRPADTEQVRPPPDKRDDPPQPGASGDQDMGSIG